MSITIWVLAFLAALCFLVGTINVQPSVGRPINWISAGLALLVLAWLVSRG